MCSHRGQPRCDLSPYQHVHQNRRSAALPSRPKPPGGSVRPIHGHVQPRLHGLRYSNAGPGYRFQWFHYQSNWSQPELERIHCCLRQRLPVRQQSLFRLQQPICLGNTINHQGNGIPNFYTRLSAHSATPAQAGTIRQGFKETTLSLNPYTARTPHDFYMLGNIYDSINVDNPLSNSQLLEWMTKDSRQLTNSTFQFALRNDIYWQDGRKVTSFDVKFSYQTLKDTGAFQGSGLAPMTDVTVLSPTQFNINLKAVGPFTKLTLTAPTIIPGRYWSASCAGTTWDDFVRAGNVPDSCNVADPNKIQPGYDPLLHGIVIGSGPWVCESATGVRGVGCDSKADGTQNPDTGG